MDRHRVGVVIPALNESVTISDVVATTLAYGVPIVVDDGSTDDTADSAAQAGALVVTHERNRGYDAALNSGFAKAAEIGCEIIITLDADGQHDPGMLGHFIAAVEGGYDVVIGARSRRQRLAEHVFAWYTTRRYGIDDPLCGMKAYRTTVFRELGHFDSYGSIGTELAFYAANNGFRVGQQYIVVRERNGQARFGPLLQANCRIFRAMLLLILK